MKIWTRSLYLVLVSICAGFSLLHTIEPQQVEAYINIITAIDVELRKNTITVEELASESDVKDLIEFFDTLKSDLTDEQVARLAEPMENIRRAYVEDALHGGEDAVVRSSSNKILCSLLVKCNLIAQNLTVCGNTTLHNLTVNGTITTNGNFTGDICGVPACYIAGLISGATSADIPDTLVLRDGGNFAATTITVTGMPGIVFLSSNGNSAALQPSATTASYTYILPPDTGTSGFVLSTDGGTPTATLTWVAAGAGSGITSLNGATATTQFLTTGTQGTLFTWITSGNNTNQIVIPYAGNLPNNASGVGLITGADFFNFSHPPASGITSINGANAAVQTLITSSAGTLFEVNPTSSSNNTILIPYAGNLPNNATGVGLITGADYYNFSHPPASGITSINGATASAQLLTTGTQGTSFTWITSGNNTNQIVIPYAGNVSGINVGLITGQDWLNFENTYTTVLAATPNDVANTLVLRNGSGSFAASTVTVTTVTFLGTNGFALSLSAGTLPASEAFVWPTTSPVTGQVLGFGGGTQLVWTNTTNTSLLNTATWCDTPNTLVLRDATGSFAASRITLTGNNNSLINYSTVGGCDIGSGFVFAPTSQNTIIGTNAGNNNALSGNANTAFGNSALATNATGTSNSAFGYQAMSNSTASFNTAIGYQALQHDNVFGGSQVAVGFQALQTNRGLSEGNSGLNTAVGYQAIQSAVNTQFDVAVGYQALQNDTGFGSNTAVGFSALQADTSGNSNTAIGYYAMHTANTSQDVAVGYQTLLADTGGSNTAVGYQALSGVTGGFYNVAVGFNAGSTLTTGTSNIFIGANVGASYTGNGSIFIGNTILTPSADNQIVIGNPSSALGGSFLTTGSPTTTTTIYGCITLPEVNKGTGYIASFDVNGQLLAAASSRRYKDNIAPLLAELSDTVYRLNPVQFNFKNSPDITSLGLVAEEVHDVCPQIVLYNKQGEPDSVNYLSAQILALDALIKLNKRCDMLTGVVQEQQASIALLQLKLQQLLAGN